MITSYHLQEAKLLLDKESDDNLIKPYLLNLSDNIQAFLLEDEKQFILLKNSFSIRISLLEEGDDESPYYNYCIGETYILQGIILLKSNDYVRGIQKIRTGYHLMEDCLDDNPSFLPAQKDLFAIQATIGAIPDNYRWVVKLIGFDGNLTESMSSYKNLLTKLPISPDYKFYDKEAEIIYAYLLQSLMNQPQEAWKTIQKSTLDFDKNPISAMIRASIGLRVKKNKEASEALSPYKKVAPIPFMDYYQGVVSLQQLQPNAGYYFSRFLRTNKSKNYIKDGYLKLGWSFLLKGDTAYYQNALNLAKKYGTLTIDEDKSAFKEAQKKTVYPIPLLKARLLYDGGFFKEAKQALFLTKTSDILQLDYKIEYLYRNGVIHEGLKQDKEALKFYQDIILHYDKVKLHFIPASCLYSGMIYERKKQYPQSKYYYSKCLEYSGYPYYESLSAKAKAGLARIGG